MYKLLDGSVNQRYPKILIFELIVSQVFLLTKPLFIGFEGSMCAVERIKVQNWRGNVWLEEVRCKLLDRGNGKLWNLYRGLFVYEKSR